MSHNNQLLARYYREFFIGQIYRHQKEVLDPGIPGDEIHPPSARLPAVCVRHLKVGTAFKAHHSAPGGSSAPSRLIASCPPWSRFQTNSRSPCRVAFTHLASSGSRPPAPRSGISAVCPAYEATSLSSSPSSSRRASAPGVEAVGGDDDDSIPHSAEEEEEWRRVRARQ